MKPGLEPGLWEKMWVTVTGEMTASFGGKEVRPALSTVAMVYYMEWVGRKVILPFLEAGEEGVGRAISVQHQAPAPVGKEVIFTAEVVEVDPPKVICRVRAEHEKGVIGEGTFTQAILPKQAIRDRMEQMK